MIYHSIHFTMVVNHDLMSLQFIMGNSGNGKTKYLFNRGVKEAKANLREDTILIVPEQCRRRDSLYDFVGGSKAIVNGMC